MSVVVFWIQDVPSTGAQYTEHQNCGDDTTLALKVAEARRRLPHVHHVCIASDFTNRVGKDGVADIVDGVLPDGSDYTWKMRR